MIPATPESLTRAEIKAVFRRHPGEKRDLAKKLGFKISRISDWFGKRGASKEIDTEVRKRAAELINAERQAAKGARN